MAAGPRPAALLIERMDTPSMPCSAKSFVAASISDLRVASPSRGLRRMSPPGLTATVAALTDIEACDRIARLKFRLSYGGLTVTDHKLQDELVGLNLPA